MASKRKGETDEEWRLRRNARQREYRARNREKVRETTRKSAYKTKFGHGAYEHYQERVAEQGGVCAICGKEEQTRWAAHDLPRGLCLDHCHKTGQLRGALCSRCNLVIGMVDDDPDYLAKCAEYLAVYGAA